MGKSTVFVNGQGMSSTNSDAVTVSGPDVCLTPAGSALVPIPYVNVAKSASLESGTKTVTIDGGMGAIDGCCYGKSTGDEAGSGKGVGSGTVGDKAEFINYSFDVKIEGKGACRNADAMMQNNRNAMGMNQDSSASHPEGELEEQTAKGTFRFRVVEHLSWDAYDEGSKSFRLGHRDNKPVAGRKFKIRMPDGGEVERSTDDNGEIEIPGQDPRGRFEIIFEPGGAESNDKHHLFYNKSPIRKKP